MKLTSLNGSIKAPRYKIQQRIKLKCKKIKKFFIQIFLTNKKDFFDIKKST